MRLIKSRAPGKIRVKADRPISVALARVLPLRSPLTPSARCKVDINEKRKEAVFRRAEEKLPRDVSAGGISARVGGK